jgi:anaerobic glycerol-3-phosphate dehydrogenase
MIRYHFVTYLGSIGSAYSSPAEIPVVNLELCVGGKTIVLVRVEPELL